MRRRLRALTADGPALKRSFGLSEILNVTAVLGLVGLVVLYGHRPPPGADLPPSPPAAASAYPRPPVAETITGPVAHISDGDTLYIATIAGACAVSRRASGCRAIRLQGLDAPESDQPCTLPDGQTTWCGATARAALVELIGGRDLVCETPADDPTDRYGRALAFCRAGEVDINLEMVRQGHAVAYRQFLKSRPHAAAYIAAEAEAYQARRGIWGTRFVSPGDWRKSSRAG